MTSDKEIHIAAALVTRHDGKALLVRKRSSTAFIQPGGKIQDHEEPAMALCRELKEELQLLVHPAQLIYIGCYAAPAVNEPGYVVVAEVFRLEVEESVTPDAEIEEIIWIDPTNFGDLTLAPLTRDHILPLLNLA